MTFNPSPASDQQTTSTENNTPETVETPTPTPEPTPTPTPTPANPAPGLLSAYSAVISEKDQEIARLRAQVEQHNAPAPLTPEEQSKRFFETPLDLIRSEIANAVKPLNEFVNVTKRENEYAALKTQMRADPRFSRLSEIEAKFDIMMKNSPLDPNTMIGAYYAVLGMMLANGELNQTPAAPTPTPTPAPAVNTPAHLRPSPNTPITTPKPARRQLTENERRLARASGLTDDQYLDELEGPATLIVTK